MAFDLDQEDCLGHVPIQLRSGTWWTNQKRNVDYIVIDFSWEADYNKWMVVYRAAGEDNRATFTRSIHSWKGANSNGQTRFVRISE